MNGTPRIARHAEEARNYFYRGLLTVAFVAKAFGDGELVAHLDKCISQFEKAAGMNFNGRATSCGGGTCCSSR
jgi:hypothetical protein